MIYQNYFYGVFDFFSKNHTRYEPLDICLEYINQQNTSQGLCLELGVWKGHSIEKIYNTLPHFDVYGFDSFTGLPEKWRNGYDKQSFSLDGNLPDVNKNIKLVKGLFADTIPKWLESNTHTKIDLLHVDCDLYSSSFYSLCALNHLIKSGTIIVFDEFINYPEYEEHEFKALYMYSQKYNRKFSYLCCGGYNLEKFAVQII